MSNQDNRHGKGYAEWIGRGDRGCWFARVSVPGGKQQRFKLSTQEGRFLTEKEADRQLARELTAEMSEAIRERIYEQERTRVSARLTVKQLGEQWTSGELFKLHGEVRGLKIKRSAKDDAFRLRAYVYPFIGNTAVCDVTEIDIERTMARAAEKAKAKLGRPWRQASKQQLYAVLHRLFDLAIKPARLRSDSPVSPDLRPRKDAPKLFSFLYPDELVAVLGCESVSLARRVHYALGAFTGLRKSSLAALRWESIDFENDTIVSLVSKTDLPQVFLQSDPALPGLRSLLTILKRYHELQGCPPASARIVTDLGCQPGREALTLRADLKAAGVTRELLFSTAANVEPLRFHDLRATFTTWARRAGKGTGWIADRTGHLTEEQMRRYDRAARTLADLKYTPFPDISAAIPELANDLANVARLAHFRRD